MNPTINRYPSIAFLDGRYVQITGSAMTGSLSITVDDANALLVETAGGTDILKVDTSTPAITIGANVDLGSNNLTTLGIGTDSSHIINQLADDVGLQVNGFDDKSGEWAKVNVDSDGYGGLYTSDYTIIAGGERDTGDERGFRFQWRTSWADIYGIGGVSLLNWYMNFKLSDDYGIRFGGGNDFLVGVNAADSDALHFVTGTDLTNNIWLSVDTSGATANFQDTDITTEGIATLGVVTQAAATAALTLHSFNDGDPTGAHLIDFTDVEVGASGEVALVVQEVYPGPIPVVAFENCYLGGDIYTSSILMAPASTINVYSISDNGALSIINTGAARGVDVTIGEAGDPSSLTVNGTTEIMTTADPQLHLTHTDGVDECDFYVNSDGELEVMPTARAIYLGDGTAGDATFGFYGNTSIYTLIHDDSEGELRLSANDATNFTQFSADGTMTMHGTAKVKKSLWLPFETLRTPGVKPATYVDHGISGAWEFSDATDDTVVFLAEIPADMDRSVALTMKLGWSTNTTVTTETAVWQLEYLWMSSGEDTTAVAQETLTTQSNAIAQANGLIIAEFTGVDLPSANDICIHCRLKRLGADGNDDLTDTAELHGVCLEYTSNKLGADLT